MTTSMYGPLAALLLVAFAGLPAVYAAGQEIDPRTTDTRTEPLGPLFEAERNVRRTFARFFKRSRDTISHERGWEELRAYAHDDRIYPLLLELFEREPTTVRNQLADFFAEHAAGHSQTMLAWIAVFEEDDEEHRSHAEARLAELAGEDGPSDGAQRVMAMGLKSGEDGPINAAAKLVQRFNLLRAVPLLAQAQVQPRGGSGRDVRRGAIAQIVVGTQQAFVADLTPVVATGAVAFQPTVGVVSSGTVLRVIDAVVYEYRTDVHQILVGMTTAAANEPTGHLGYDAPAWQEWYARVLEPRLDAQHAGS